MDIQKNRGIETIRHVAFKNVTYDLGKGNLLEINPIPFWENGSEDNLVRVGHEKYKVEGSGELNVEKISLETIGNFDKFLSKYLDALRRLT